MMHAYFPSPLVNTYTHMNDRSGIRKPRPNRFPGVLPTPRCKQSRLPPPSHARVPPPLYSVDSQPVSFSPVETALRPYCFSCPSAQKRTGTPSGRLCLFVQPRRSSALPLCPTLLPALLVPNTNLPRVSCCRQQYRHSAGWSTIEHFGRRRLLVRLVLNQSYYHAVEVEEEHDQVESEFDEGLLWVCVSIVSSIQPDRLVAGT